MTDISSYIRSIPDFPQPGVMFRDLTPLLADGHAFRTTVDLLAGKVGESDLVAGVEARGFLFGAALAYRNSSGLIIIRKPGKLPSATISHEYALEYGQDRLEMHADAVPAGARVLLIDDVLATGGTAEAAVELLRKAGAVVTQALFVIGLPALGGEARLAALGVKAESLVTY